MSGESIEPGRFARLTLEFESGQESEVNVPVVPAEDEFSEITPAEPSTSPTP